jgi:hypothetical protein
MMQQDIASSDRLTFRGKTAVKFLFNISIHNIELTIVLEQSKNIFWFDTEFPICFI